MIEQLLNIVSARPGPYYRPIVYLDSVTGRERVRGATMTFNGSSSYGNSGVILDSRQTFNIPTLASTSANIVCQWSTPIVLSFNEMTIEWTVKYNATPTSMYINEFTMYTGSVNPLLIRTYDNGRLMVEFNGQAAVAMALTALDLANKTIKWTLIFKDSKLYVYHNGVLLKTLAGADFVPYTKTTLQQVGGFQFGGWAAGANSTIRNFSSVDVVEGNRYPVAP